MKKITALIAVISMVIATFTFISAYAQEDEFFSGIEEAQEEAAGYETPAPDEEEGLREMEKTVRDGNPEDYIDRTGDTEPSRPGGIYIPKDKLPTSAGIEMLREEFNYYQGPTVYGVRANDYALYDPRGKNDTHKYPLVVYIHGAFHGLFRGGQVDDSDFPYWASEELQSRFDAGGAFIMLPRSTGVLTFWDSGQVPSIKAAIDDVISRAGNNIDTSKIVIMGSSDGGAMVRKVICSYPDFFCGALTLCQTGFYNSVQAQVTADVPIWLIACKKDFFVLYPFFQVPMWNTIKRNTNVKDKCRFTSLEELYYPDGSKPTNTHNLARVASYDLQMLDGSDYPYCETVDGWGRILDLHAGNGIIAWINEL